MTRVISLLVSFSFAGVNGQNLIKGFVLDSATMQPVPYVNVTVRNAFTGATTDERGFFSVKIDRFPQTLFFHHITYVRKSVDVQDDADTIRVLLYPQVLKLGTITVEAERTHEVPGSTYFIPATRARNAPALVEADMIRVATFLPGVTQSNDLKSTLHIRGGASDQVQMFYDGIEIYNPRHLLGLYGAFNMAALEQAEVYSGNMPSKYGDRLSGVMAFETKDPRVQVIQLQASLLSAGVVISRHHNDNSVLLAARRTYLDVATSLFGNEIPYNFYDANLKLTKKISSGMFFDVIGFLHADNLAEEKDVTATHSPDAFRWGNYLVATRLRRMEGNANLSLTASYTQNFVSSSHPNQLTYLNNNVHDFSIQFQGAHTYTYHQVQWGGSYKYLKRDYEWNSTGSTLTDILYSGAPLKFRLKDNEEQYVLWLSDKIFLSETLFWQNGIRFRYSNPTIIRYLSPRSSLIWEPSDTWEWHASYGLYFQSIVEGVETKEGALTSPLFSLTRSMRASIYSAGLRFKPQGHYHVSLETYYRNFERIARLVPTNRPFPGFEYGTGRAYGFDLWLEKHSGQITFQASYSFTRTFVKYASTSEFPADWDIPHSIKSIVGWKPGSTWLFNMAFTYKSGLPYTPVLGSFFGPGGQSNDPDHTVFLQHFVDGQTNDERFPSYIRLDLSARKTYKRRKIDTTLFLQVQNVLYQIHPLRYDWGRRFMYRSSDSGKTAGIEDGLPIIPSIGVEVEWRPESF
jgi:hypothetical protein